MFFTFYEFKDFNKDKWVIDHVNGTRSDNHFINLWPMPKRDNVKVRDKLNRNNVSGTNGICKSGGTWEREEYLETYLIGQPRQDAPDGTLVRQRSVVFTDEEKAGIPGAIRERARMEVEAGHFNNMCRNHILYMFLKRHDLYVLHEKFFDDTYVEGGSGDDTAEGEGDDAQADEGSELNVAPSASGNTRYLLRGTSRGESRSTATSRNDTPQLREGRGVTPGSATARRQQRKTNTPSSTNRSGTVRIRVGGEYIAGDLPNRHLEFPVQ